MRALVNLFRRLGALLAPISQPVGAEAGIPETELVVETMLHGRSCCG